MTEPPTQPLQRSSIPVTFVTDRDFAGRQLVGSRAQQEDFYAFSDVSETAGEPHLSQLLIGLGDGLGAHTGGNIASAHFVTEFIKAYKSSQLADSWRMRIALEQANEHLLELSRRYGGHLPMGTTFVGLHITRSYCQWISVGDSPLFIFRDGKLDRLNADHSLTPILEDRVRNGELTAEEALTHPDRHILQSACMGQPLTLVDARTYPYDLHSGDILIAASDGILTLDRSEIEELLNNGRRNTAAQLTNSLLFAIRCIDHPRQDNVTIALVKIP